MLLIEGETEKSSIAATLKKAGYEVSCERTVEGAAKLASSADPDVVLVELPLAGVEPGTALARLRAAAPRPPLILLSDRAHEDDAVSALKEGAQDYLTTPGIKPHDLDRSIRRALQRQQLVLELQARIQELEAEDARLAAILQTTTDAIMIVDRAGVIRFANAAAEQMFGRTANQLEGEIFGYPITGHATAEIDLVGRSGATVAELRANAIEWDGQLAAIVSLRDITERKRAEERERTLIREQTARLQAEVAERRANFLAEVGNELGKSLDGNLRLDGLARLIVPFLADWCAVDVVENDGSIRRLALAYADPANATLADQLNALSEEHNLVLGIAQVLRDRRPHLIADISEQQIIQSGAPPELVNLLVQLKPCSALIIPLIARGRALGVLSLSYAESRRRYDERDLEFAEEVARRAAIAVDNARLYAEAQLANKAKADFLAIMSHELRTPLNAVIGYADLLLMGVPAELPATAIGHIDRIRRSARHLLRLIEEILLYARMEAGREQLDIEEFDAEPVIRDAISLIEPQALGRKLDMMCRLPTERVTLRSDPGKLQQVLLNLLSNAVKFTDAGEVGLEFSMDGQTARFVVWDTGIGLSKESMRHIFEPFWQAEQSRSRRAEGTGLGLTVARSLAKLLGGDLEFDSELGTGTRFTLHIPARIMLPRA